MSTGSALEAAIAAAAKHYQAADRAELAKQHTPRLFGGAFAGKASVDFKGWHGAGRLPLYVECKATTDHHVEFRDLGDGIREVQLSAMRDAVRRGIRMLLIVDCVPEREVYVIEVVHVVAFAEKPWRKSLSLQWLRAHGEVAKEEDRDGRHRRVWFLDTKAHDGRAAAYLACAAEHAQSAGTVVELYPAELKPSKKLHERMATRPAPGSPEYKEYVRQLADEGMRRAMGARPKTFGARGKRKGWAR